MLRRARQRTVDGENAGAANDAAGKRRSRDDGKQTHGANEPTEIRIGSRHDEFPLATSSVIPARTPKPTPEIAAPFPRLRSSIAALPCDWKRCAAIARLTEIFSAARKRGDVYTGMISELDITAS